MKERLILPEGYNRKMSIRDTERGVKMIKDMFEQRLAKALKLERVSAPLFVKSGMGLNDNLNGIERPVVFDLLEQPGSVYEIVHSLAKWKRMALANYGFSVGEGLYTDMNAIRRDEMTDNLHSIYVDQWDWELVISKEQRTTEFLQDIVRKIYNVVRDAEREVSDCFGTQKKLPDEIAFFSTYELEEKYPNLTGKEREHAIAREYGAVFISQIGGRLKNGGKHDGRAPDYDDWTLNGDIVLYYPLLDCAFEISSMGIRVDEAALVSQLRAEGCEDRLELPFQKALVEGKLPYTIGGGIGQSRLCMYMLDCAHIGEVQSSVWPAADVEVCKAAGIKLL
ncbi:MAG: aspartate--ammonia ligase [Oscillospiraceae bacterium]|nr:aspartate--ammonia ligase [Oscillospiraceae bacterium]